MKKTILLLALVSSALAFSAFGAGGSLLSKRFENRNDPPQGGRVFWSGKVDDVVRLRIQGSRLTVETVSGQSYGEGTSSFTTPLPEAEVAVGVIKKKGRGTAAVVQQPDHSNDFTAVVEIRDLKGGAKEYQLEIYWN